MTTWAYTAVSWVLLLWHGVWRLLLGPDANSWSWILAIVSVVVSARLLVLPIIVRAIRTQRAMKTLAPEIKRLQSAFKTDRERMQKEMMALYRREKANPLMGCLPLFVPVPVIACLYHVIKHVARTSTAGRTLYGWSPSQYDAAAHARVFGAPISASLTSSKAALLHAGADPRHAVLSCGILVIIMVSLTFITGWQAVLKLPLPQDGTQELSHRLLRYGLPLSALAAGWHLPAGLLVYFIAQSLFTLVQQAYFGHLFIATLNF